MRIGVFGFFCAMCVQPMLPLMARADIPDTAPNVRIVDNSDVGFSTANSPGSWSKAFNSGSTDSLINNDYHLAGSEFQGKCVATWSISLNPGLYRISVSWHDAGAYSIAFSSAAVYTVSAGGAPLGGATLNQQKRANDRTDAGVGWADLGQFLVSVNPVVVRITHSDMKSIMADAVRFERLDGDPITTPAIESFRPWNGSPKGGARVTVTGSHFEPQAVVYFGDQPAANTTFIDSTTVVAIAPAMGPGLVPITVENPGPIRSDAHPRHFSVSPARVIDDQDPGFSTTGSWVKYVVLGDCATKGMNCASMMANSHNAAETDQASWTFQIIPGLHRVAMTWPYDIPYGAIPYFASIPVEIWDGDVLIATAAINEQIPPPADLRDQNVNWQDFGTFEFQSETLKVTLNPPNVSPAVWTRADAARIEEIYSPDEPSTSIGGPAVTVTLQPTACRKDAGCSSIAVSSDRTDCSITFYDRRGDRIRRLPVPGTAEWNVDGLASGIYIYLFECPEGTVNGKVAILR